MTAELSRRVREGMPVLRFVARSIAKRLGGHVDVDELISIGQPALLEAAQTYDPARATFATYAALKLKWAMLDGLRREAGGRRVSVARAAALAASARFGEGLLEASEPTRDAMPATEEEHKERLRGILEGHAAALVLGLCTAAPDEVDDVADSVESPEDFAARGELRVALQSAVGELPERERALILRHYFGGEPFDVIARDLGISKSWASRLHAQAIQALAASLRSRDLERERLL